MNPLSTLMRAAALLLLSLCFFTEGVHAQITIDRSNFPFPLGTYEFAEHVADNESGASTAALEAIIAASGPGQTYDFSTVAFDDVLTGTHTMVTGAVGPGAEDEHLGSATHTLVFPLRTLEDSVLFVGTIYLYIHLSDARQRDLGAYMTGEVDGEEQSVTMRSLPGGDTTSVFPTSFGSAWTSTYSQTIFGFTSDVSAEYSVDGWGTLVGPGAEGGVPALRVRVEETVTFFGFPSTSVCYEFRSTAPVLANVCEGGLFAPPTAQFMVLGAQTTSAEREQPLAGARLEVVYPNPASNAAQLAFELDEPGQIRLAVFDVLGREVRHLGEESRAAGHHAVIADVSDLAPGLYFARLSVNGQSWTRPFSVVR